MTTSPTHPTDSSRSAGPPPYDGSAPSSGAGPDFAPDVFALVRRASQSDVLALVGRHGTFDSTSAQRFAPVFRLYTTIGEYIDTPITVNWPYCAEGEARDD